MRRSMICRALLASAAVISHHNAADAQSINYFTPGDLVISTVSNQVASNSIAFTANGANGLDTASPITLQELTAAVSTNGAQIVGSLTLPQTSSGANSAISGEYGSASEGILQQSANGQLLTIVGYGVNANTFNSAINNSTAVGTFGTTALGQTTSLTGQSVQTVARVVATIGTTGTVDSSTALTGVFNTNNPRSAATVDGSSFYVSGQGASKTDTTQGVFYALKGATTATAIDNSTETRAATIYNGTLYVSRDQNPPGSGAQNSTNVSSLTNSSGGLPTSSTGLVTTHIIPPASPNSLGGNNGSINVTAGTANGINNSRIGNFVYLSPEQFYFANATTLYVTDSGQPKNGNANKAALGEGGLQKWSLVGGVWVLDYDLVAGLSLVNNATTGVGANNSGGVTGLFGLACNTVGGSVQCYATSYGLNELSQSFVYEISDTLADTTITQASNESFVTVYTAPVGTNIRGVAFAPVPEPMSLALFGVGIAGIGAVVRRRRRVCG